MPLKTFAAGRRFGASAPWQTIRQHAPSEPHRLRVQAGLQHRHRAVGGRAVYHHMLHLRPGLGLHAANSLGNGIGAVINRRDDGNFHGEIDKTVAL